ncbi:MAG: OB-fold nucleic acid binding domain-containing protein, partial [Patescibacteria group bacterium]
MFIKNLSLSVGKEVELKGWVYNLRSSGSIAFLQIRDGSGFVQAIVDKKSVPEAVWETAQKITVETS